MYKGCLIAVNTKAFDHFELEDIANSRLMIESHLSKTFRSKLQVGFGNLKQFNICPGSVLFLMALETCNASVALDIEGSILSLVSLTLFLSWKKMRLSTYH